jgi:4-carboxymuconolactone decarboxylase
MKNVIVKTFATCAVLAATGFAAAQTKTAGPSAPAVTKTAKPTANQRLFGDFAPKFADLTDNVLFADVWERPGLSKRDRSLATVAALVAMNRPDQLRFHLVRARENGVAQEELVETITHLAFYAGWPSAYSAMTVAKEVLPPKK